MVGENFAEEKQVRSLRSGWKKEGQKQVFRCAGFAGEKRVLPLRKLEDQDDKNKRARA